MKKFIFIFIILFSSISYAEEYSRELFGSGWKDLDFDCQNSRIESLIEHASEITMSGKCSIKAGVWYDPYSDKIYSNPKNLDIDHIIPLHYYFNYTLERQTKENRIKLYE